MNTYLIIVLAILVGSYLLNLIVEILNIKHLSDTIPDEFRGVYDPEKYAASQKYQKEHTTFELYSDTFFTAVTVAFILLGGFSLADRAARSFGCGEILTGLLFAGMLLLGFHLLHIPFSLYETFVIEEKYGFNRITPKTFILDIIKGWILTAIIGGPLFAIVVWFFSKAGSSAWLYCWVAVSLFQIIIMFLAPVVIMPLFNKFTPLEDGELKQTIERYADDQNFKIKGVYSMDGSKRSSKSNAFFTGFGRFRRIVLFDTLIEKHSVQELLAILAHEIGHFKKKHIFQQMAISIASTGIMFFILSLFLNNPHLFSAFGMEHVSIYGSLVLFGFLFSPIEMIISITANKLSRRNEYEADIFAIQTTSRPDALIQALKKLCMDNMSNLTPHPFKVTLFYSHPPVLHRISYIRNTAAQRPAKAQ